MIKARDIYNMYNDYSFGYEMYLVLPHSAEGQTITLTSTKKDYCDFPRNIHLQYEETRWQDLSKVKCDLKNGCNYFFNLKHRGFTISNVDVWSELVLSHFEIDKETNKIIFVFSYKGGVL